MLSFSFLMASEAASTAGSTRGFEGSGLWCDQRDFRPGSGGGARTDHASPGTASPGTARRLTRGTADAAPAWSPDGTKIAFSSNASGLSQIYVMNADGSGVTRLTNDSSVDGTPTSSVPLSHDD